MPSSSGRDKLKPPSEINKEIRANRAAQASQGSEYREEVRRLVQSPGYQIIKREANAIALNGAVVLPDGLNSLIHFCAQSIVQRAYGLLFTRLESLASIDKNQTAQTE